jgi:hypothetical protein
VLHVLDVASGAVSTKPLPRFHRVIAWSPESKRVLLNEGLVVDAETGRFSRPFGFWEVMAAMHDWSRAAVSVEEGFGYGGTDLYLAEPLSPRARLVSPRRCDAQSPDCLEGTDGNDTLFATTPKGRIRGLAGDDRLVGGSGYSLIEGSFGNDLIFGNGSNDHLFGGLGRDRIFGGPGQDLIIGGPNDDVLVTGPGRGRVYGESGNDVIDARAGGRTRIFCGEGNDVVLANRLTSAAFDCERMRRTRRP